MGYFAVFITAERVPPKVSDFPLSAQTRVKLTLRCQAANRAFLLIQDFEFSEYPADARWTLLTSKQLPAAAPHATTLPLPDLSRNAFASLSLADINAFVRAHEDALKALDLSAGNWLVIDQKGLETGTALVCEQRYNHGGEGAAGPGYTQAFRACRLPYAQAHGMIVNLDIANIWFEEAVDGAAGEQADGSWKWQPFVPDETEEKRPEEVKREKALKALRDAGHAD